MKKNTLMTLFDLVKPAIRKAKFILCMMQLRFGISIIYLAERFQISKTTTADTFLDFRYSLCKDIITFYMA